ncbi:MAG: translation initiation factor [Planctomycetaceae bacterium]|nr:translation initiation factor [Planctomycetaceae bacterium]
MTRLLAGTIYDRPPVCDRCAKPEAECSCPPIRPPARGVTPPAKQTARLSIEKRKKGKIVSVIRGLPTSENDLAELLSRLKSACGAGGTLDGDAMEIQGDHREKLAQLLAELGYKTK